ncbi:MAG: 4-hydroxy-tetrahydrodipicolinate synthase [Bradymonadales bacterium]|nr:4-hydroxy-tetrahydrodipicolinate synthase [Bradymonadales bacterium]
MERKTHWQGFFPAVPTPFRDDHLDRQAFEAHIGYLLANGADGLVVSGTTGEGATLTAEERSELVAIAVRTVDRKVPVIAGVGTNSTTATLRAADEALKAGADGLLVVTPYYNKPPQEGLILHFSQVARHAGAPTIIYNVPSRTGVSITPETIAQLADLPQIVAVKDATADLRQGSRIIDLVGDRLTVFSGDDFTALALMALGGHGVISVVGNVDPRRTGQMVHSALEGDFQTARRLHHQLTPLTEALFCTTNPIPAKAALALLGFGDARPRSPLVPLAEPYTHRLVQVMRDLGLLTD